MLWGELMKLLLSAHDQQRRRVYYTQLTEAAQALDEAIDKANNLITSARRHVESALVNYNNVLAEARDWAEEIANEVEQELALDPNCDARTRTACNVWMHYFRNADFEPVVCDFPEAVVLEIEDHPQVLIELPSRAVLESATFPAGAPRA